MPETEKNTLMEVSIFPENSYKEPEIGMTASNRCHPKGQVLVNNIFLDEPVAYGKAGKLDVILNTQLFKQAVAISAGCFRAETEIYGDILVRHTPYNHQHYLHLTLGKFFYHRPVAMVNE